MIAYEFYCRDEESQDSFIGILPERRERQERISRQSVMNWVRTILGDNLRPIFDKIYFIQVEV